MATTISTPNEYMTLVFVLLVLHNISTQKGVKLFDAFCSQFENFTLSCVHANSKSLSSFFKELEQNLRHRGLSSFSRHSYILAFLGQQREWFQSKEQQSLLLINHLQAYSLFLLLAYGYLYKCFPPLEKQIACAIVLLTCIGSFQKFYPKSWFFQSRLTPMGMGFFRSWFLETNDLELANSPLATFQTEEQMLGMRQIDRAQFYLQLLVSRHNKDLHLTTSKYHSVQFLFEFVGMLGTSAILFWSLLANLFWELNSFDF